MWNDIYASLGSTVRTKEEHFSQFSRALQAARAAEFLERDDAQNLLECGETGLHSVECVFLHCAHPFAAGHEQGIPTHSFKGPHRAIDPADHDFDRVGKGSFGI